jgi:hypothetical protein
MFLDFFASEAKMEEGRPDLVVLDIEGTITTLDYVRVELMGWVQHNKEQRTKTKTASHTKLFKGEIKQLCS